MFFYKLLNIFYNDQILGQASRKIGESVGSISRGPTPGGEEGGEGGGVEVHNNLNSTT
jgi:hypothetical protein